MVVVEDTTTILFVSLTCAAPVPALSARHAGILAAALEADVIEELLAKRRV